MLTNINFWWHGHHYCSATGNLGKKVSEDAARIQELEGEGREVGPAVTVHDLVVQATSTTKHTGNKIGLATTRREFLWMSS